MKYDDVVECIGGYGRYQQTVFFLLALPIMSNGVHTLITVFTMAVPAHRCAIPGLDNDTYAIQGDDHARTIASTIPPDLDGGQRYSSCLLYVADVTVRGVEGDNKTSYECDRWVYDTASFGSTIVTQLNWVCARKLNKSIAQMVFKLGKLFSFFVLVIPADFLGRKNMLMLAISIHIASTILLTFAQSFDVFLVLYCLDGAAVVATWSNALVIVVELVGPSKRVFVGIALDLMWTIGTLLCGAVAYYVRDWQLLQLILSVPCVIFLTYFWTACNLGFYTLGLGVQNLEGNLYTNYGISVLMELLGFTAALLLLDRIGRKLIYCTSLIVGGFSCIAAIIPIVFADNSMGWLTVTLAMIGRGFVSTAFATVWLYTLELFPTVIRTSTVAAANIISRSVGAAAPYMANMAQLIPGKFGKLLPLVIIGVIMTLAGLLALLLPETFKRKLPETINDAVVLQRGIVNADSGEEPDETTSTL